MSIAGYFSVGKDGRRRESPVAEAYREAAIRAALEAATREAALGGAERREVYRKVGDYDPVLQSHCGMTRRNESFGKPSGASGRQSQ